MIVQVYCHTKSQVSWIEKFSGVITTQLLLDELFLTTVIWFVDVEEHCVLVGKAARSFGIVACSLSDTVESLVGQA